MHRVPLLVATAAAALLSLTACDAVQDAAEDQARETAGDVACSAAQEAVDQASSAASGAADAIGADPQAAREDLQAVSDALAVAQAATNGNLSADLTNAKTAIDVLVSQAAAAAAGGLVDTNAVNAAQAQLDSAVQDVQNAC